MSLRMACGRSPKPYMGSGSPARRRRHGTPSSHLMSSSRLIAATTGLRRSEFLALRWPDIDLDAGTASIRRGKSGTARRTIHIPKSTVVRPEVTPEGTGRAAAALRCRVVGQ